MPRRWWVVIPVKPTHLGKSRLVGRSRGTVRRIAELTIAAAVATPSVAGVVVVTAERGWPSTTDRVWVVRERAPRGITAAIRAGLDIVPAHAPVAVLLGDVPGARPAELAAALAAAGRHPRAFVADAEGTGTTLVTARAGVPLRSRFGASSARRHRDAGLVELPIPVDAGLRRDVDTWDQLTPLVE